MDTRRFFRCTPATRNAEVVTARAYDGRFVTTILNGPLDGESFTAETEVDSLVRHKSAVELARLADQDDGR